MVKLPKQITLLGKVIPIERAPLKKAYGLMTPVPLKITISESCPDYLIEDVLLHEIVHALFEITGQTQLMSLELEEAICRAMENLTSIYKLRGKN